MERFTDHRHGTRASEASRRRSRRRGARAVCGRCGALVLVVLLVLSTVTGVTGVSGRVGDTVANGEASIDYEGDEVTVTAERGQRIAGRTDLPPGTRLTVRLRSSGSSPFLISTTAVVADDGSFRATVDLTNARQGSEFEAAVHHNGTVLTTAPGVVVECRGECDGTAPAEPTATLFPDGEAALTAGPGQPVAGTSNLPPGTRVRVQLRGTDGGLPPLETRAVVDSEGRFRTVADLRGVSAGTALRVSVRWSGTTLATSRATVGECTERCRAPSGSAQSPFLNGTEPRRSGVAETTQGQRVRLPLDVERGGVATLSIGGPAGSYAADLALRDGNGDGSVVVLFDTANASDLSRALTVADEADTVRVRGTPTTPGNGTLDAGEYPLALYRGTNTEPVVGLLLVRASGSADPVARFGFRRSPLTVRAGETTTVPLRLDETTAATLTVEGPGYELSAVVRDGTGDERVTLRLATGAAENGSRPALTTLADGDTVRVQTAEGAVQPGEYRLSLTRGADTSVAEAPSLWSANGRLIVSQAPASPSGGGPASPGQPRSLPGLAALAAGGLLAVGGLLLLTGAFEA